MTAPKRLPVVVVTGLSGAGKASILRALEDVGYEAVDNPPLPMLEEMVARGDRKLAIGVDARTRGFDADRVLTTLERMRGDPRLRPELVYAWANETTLLRRYSESRRRHPLSPEGRVSDGIAAEEIMTEPLRQAADLVIDTSDLPVAVLRQTIERHFGTASEDDVRRLAVSLVSFAYPKGLPREADLVFDARFLRNPHYDPILRPKTGSDPDVRDFVEADPDFGVFFQGIASLIELVLPRFVQEGKKYATIAIGCTGGRHRSVVLIERLAAHLQARIAAGEKSAGPGKDWRLYVTHRELVREDRMDAYMTDRPVPRRDNTNNGQGKRSLPVQAQEA
jgi:RNase adapter protein RapZ